MNKTFWLLPHIRAQPLYHSFYECKRKLNPFHGSGSNRYTALFTSSRENSILSMAQDQTSTPLFLRVKEQTQSFPRLRIKPVHRSFYEFKSKLNPFHGSGSSQYNCLKSYRNTPQHSEIIDISLSRDQTSTIVWNPIETHHNTLK